MGNAESTWLYRKLAHALPDVQQNDQGKSGGSSRGRLAFFRSETERDRFITATIALVTQNGQLALDDHDLQLCFTGQSQYITASILAVKNGSITAKLSARTVNHADSEEGAFEVLRVDVDQQFQELLKTVPDILPQPHWEAGHEDALPTDLPPSYTSAASGDGEVGKDHK